MSETDTVDLVEVQDKVELLLRQMGIHDPSTQEELLKALTAKVAADRNSNEGKDSMTSVADVIDALNDSLDEDPEAVLCISAKGTYLCTSTGGWVEINARDSRVNGFPAEVDY
jgi:hypothetical protein